MLVSVEEQQVWKSKA